MCKAWKVSLRLDIIFHIPPQWTDWEAGWSFTQDLLQPIILDRLVISDKHVPLGELNWLYLLFAVVTTSPERASLVRHLHFIGPSSHSTPCWTDSPISSPCTASCRHFCLLRASQALESGSRVCLGLDYNTGAVVSDPLDVGKPGSSPTPRP